MDQAQREQFSRELLDTYRDRIRTFLVDQQVPGVDSLDRQAELLEQALNRSADVNVGFLGEAQVGKSTLINAVIERTALPSGGLGPLTARATSVSYADQDRMSVRFHGKQDLNRFVFGIRKYLELRGDLPPKIGKQEEGVPHEEEDSEPFEALLEVGPESKELSAQTKEKGEYMLSQVRRMFGVEPANDMAPAALLDAVRSVLGHKLEGDPSAITDIEPRIADLRQRLGTSEDTSSAEPLGVRGFNAELKDRAAGWLSPLVVDLRLGLSSEVLRGLSLVDLPGIGVLGDPAARVPKEFVERDANALVIVFRNSGFTESIADLLERTGVVTRLLFGGREGHAPIHLLLAVTHVDDVARDRYRAAAMEARDAGEPPPDRHDIFRSLSRTMEETLRAQVRQALRQSASFEDLSEDLRASREAVVERLCDSMDIVCVAAPDYIDATEAAGVGTGFLTDPVTTGVPRFREALRTLARTAVARRARDISLNERLLRRDLLAQLRVLGAAYEGGQGAALKEWEEFREEMQKHLGPIREEMQAHHGDILGTLRRGLLERITILCQNAEAQAHKRLQRLTRQGQELHFMSLKAALRRDGVWELRGVNYPDALTLAMLDAIATQWEPQIVEAVRLEIRRLAERDLALVEQLVAIATQMQPKLVAESQIGAQKQVLAQSSRSAVAWTKEQLEELRERVREKLRGVIEPPIARACRRALQAGRHQGTGAKRRILEVFEDGGSEALGEARGEAEKILKQQYNGLLRKLDTGYLKEHHDPVQAAFESLTDETNRRARRSDGQRRARVLKAVTEYTKALGEVESDKEAAAETHADSDGAAG